MKKSIIIAGLLVALVGFSSPAIADSAHLTAYDAAPAFFIDNYSYTGQVSVVITGAAAGSVVVTVDGCENTIDGNHASYDTIAELTAGIAACTNDDGEVGVRCVYGAAIGTDTTKAKLLDGTYIASPQSGGAGYYTNSVKWDTSAVLHYDQFLDAEYQPIVIDKITGSMTGTGDATIDVYVDEVKVWTVVLPVPVGVSHTNDANLVTLSAILPNIPFECGVPVRAKSAAFIRSTRTTATTGNIGCTVKPQ